jgi:outer membrane receptor for ferric coprogen and ferric-rhodotorulic acid
MMYSSRAVVLVTGGIAFAVATPLPAQSARPTASGAPAAPVAMSAFEVTGEKDVGYQGGNTTSGSRLNTSLRDTPASIQVITPEFMADFGLNSLEDIAAYGPNMGVDYLETRSDPNPAFISGVGADTRVRVRGLEASAAMDFFNSLTPIDSYNTERLEVSSGPNSILFGFGNPGGLVNVTSKRAASDRTRTSFRAQFGDWSLQRYEADHNQVLVPGKAALRINTLYSYNQGWRTHDFNRTRRGALSLQVRPFASTKVTVNGETGRIRAHIALPQNAEDGVALWTAAGSRVTEDSAWTAADRAVGINRSTAVQNYYVVGGAGTTPYLIPTRNAVGGRLLMSTYEDMNVAVAARAGRTLVDPRVIPFQYSLYGPGAVREKEFSRSVITLEQRLGEHVQIDLAYNRERSRENTEKPQNQQMIFSGDPNRTIPNPTGAGAAVPNPNAGRLFFDTVWNPMWGESSQDVFRGALSGQFDLGRFGRHRLAGLYEHGETRVWAYQGRVIFADAAGRPISNALPENAANWVRFRRYITPGDFGTYHAIDGRAPISVDRGGVRYQSRTVVQAVGPRDVERTIKTAMAVAQSYFLRDRLAVTAGVRRDEITYDIHGSARYAATDPEVTSGRKLTGELHYTPEIVQSFHYRPTTFTAGAVFHLRPDLSVFYNASDNNAEPRQNQNILPDETLPPPSEGETRDYGVMVRLFDGRFFLRATRFETAQTMLTGAISLGGLVAPTTGILDALLAARRITVDEYQRHTIGDVAAMVATFDEVNSGYEVSAWFNPNRAITSQLNFSYTETDRSRIAPEFEGWFERERNFWLATPGAGRLSDPATGNTVDDNIAAMPRVIQLLRDFNNFGFGIRPYKVSLSGRYSFLEGRLRGFFAGGGVRWQSRPKLGRRTLGVGPDGLTRYGETVYGPESFTADGFIGYRRTLQLGGRRSDVTVQLNIRNLTDEDEFQPLRYNATFSGYARVILVEPRQIRGTISLSF